MPVEHLDFFISFKFCIISFLSLLYVRIKLKQKVLHFHFSFKREGGPYFSPFCDVSVFQFYHPSKSAATSLMSISSSCSI